VILKFLRRNLEEQLLILFRKKKMELKKNKNKKKLKKKEKKEKPRQKKIKKFKSIVIAYTRWERQLKVILLVNSVTF
jgi:hypothetical protein